MIPYSAAAYRERSSLLGATRGDIAREEALGRSLEKASRRAQLDHFQQEEYLEPTRTRGRREAIKAAKKREAALVTKEEAALARKRGYIVEGDKIRKRGYYEKHRKVTYRSAGFKYKGAGGTGRFTQAELEQWGGPGTSWGTSASQVAFSGTSKYTPEHAMQRMQEIKRSTAHRIAGTSQTPSITATFAATAGRDVKADITKRVLSPVLTPLFRAMKPSEARPHSTGTMLGRAFRGMGRSGLGRVPSSHIARVAFSGLGMLHPGIGAGISITKGIAGIYREA